MTLVSLSQIEEAIEVMRSSFTYDPPERWRRAYDVLQMFAASFAPRAGLTLGSICSVSQ